MHSRSEAKWRRGRQLDHRSILLEQRLEARALAGAGAVADHPKGQAARLLASGYVGVALGVGQQNRRLADLERVIDLSGGI